MMKKEVAYGSRKKVMIVLCAAAVLLAFYLGLIGVTHLLTVRNDREAQLALSQISYTETAAAAELEALEPYTQNKFLSVAQKGQLYRAMAELSYMTEDDMVYNDYIACALYYLRRSSDTDSVVYLSNKYIGKLYANGCFAAAETVLHGIAETADIASFDLEMQASYYLSCADVAQMQGKDAAPDLSNAQAAIQLMSDGGNKALNQAKYDLLCARQDIENGDFEQAEKILSAYSEADDFGLGEKQVYVICDFQIPFYELTAKLALHKNNIAFAHQNINAYLKLCDDFNFRAMKLHLLQYVVSHTAESQAEFADQYRQMEKTVSAENLAQMTDEYGQFLLRDVDNTQESLSASEQARENENRRIVTVMLGLYLAIMLYCAISVVLNYTSRDALTHLNSRKQFEEIRLQCEKKKIPYCFLMIDIDDFKKVNDTYGHARGDEVLRKTGEILLGYTGRGIYACRYGGEEMCLFFLRVPEKRARQIAEEIRGKISQTVCVEDRYITISGGIGVSENGENVFQKADRQLYEAKRNGKNQIR